MALTKHMKTMLAALLADVRRLEAVSDEPPAGMGRGRWSTLRRDRKEYEQFGVHHDLARWLGHPPTPSESAVFSRTLRNMEAMGLLVRISRWGGRRSTHVRLTPPGRAEAERLAREQEADLAELMAGVVLLLDDGVTAVEKAPNEAGN